MNFYQEKKQARIERMRERAAKKAEFSANNGLDLYGESKSGIPMGQPILVGHHSEKRHRKALERIENKVRKGFEAAEQAERLEERADAAESRTAIDSDNPEALLLIKEKIDRLERTRGRYKKINSLVRKIKDVDALAAAIKKEIPETKDAEKLAANLLTPDFAGRIGIPSFQLTSIGAEIRRLQKRLEQLAVVQNGFTPFSVDSPMGSISVELVNGQIQISHPEKPSEECRKKLKSLAFKWSRFSQKWVRKHTPTTAGKYFSQQLNDALKTSHAEGEKIWFTKEELIKQRISKVPEDENSPDLEHNAIAGHVERNGLFAWASYL